MTNWLARRVDVVTILLAAVFLPLLACAQTLYITDELTVPLRRGPSNGHKIIHAGLPSGTAMEVISKDEASGFAQVRLQNGTEGWLPVQYLVTAPIARDRLAVATKRVESLTGELASARQGMKTEQSARNSAESQSGDLGKQLKQAQTELAEIRRVSASSVAIYEENKALKASNDQLQSTANEQAAQIESLKSNDVQMWLLIGGGLVALGLVFGIAIKSRPKTRSGW